MICPSCNREFNEWFSRDKGKPQKFPYKMCYACGQAKKAGQQELPQNDSGKQNAALEMIYELREIRRILEWIQLNMVQEGKGEIGKPFDRKANPNTKEIPIVENANYPIPEGGYPY